MVNVPSRVPKRWRERDVNRTTRGDSETGRQLSVSAKSPAAAILEMESGASPEFERVIVCATLVCRPTARKNEVGAERVREERFLF